MKNGATWIAFLLMCFAVVGLTGLFGTYAPQIPLERALARSAVLDQALLAGQAPDATARLEALRPALGASADLIVSGPGDIIERVTAARAVMLSEQRREARSVTRRTRIMVGTITLLGGMFGAGVMLFAVKQSHR